MARRGAATCADMRVEPEARRLIDLAGGSGPQAVPAELALYFVFGEVEARKRLGRRDGSPVTLGGLIALRQWPEVCHHVAIGLANGLSRREIEEARVPTAPYAGFLAARAAAKVLADQAGEEGPGCQVPQPLGSCPVALRHPRIGQMRQHGGAGMIRGQPVRLGVQRGGVANSPRPVAKATWVSGCAA
ncbi:hypothetical protein GC209_17025 [bacterium]|nr:hypothetical protein [bacterium]